MDAGILVFMCIWHSHAKFMRKFAIILLYRWVIARKMQLQYVSNGVTPFLHYSIDIWISCRVITVLFIYLDLINY